MESCALVHLQLDLTRRDGEALTGSVTPADGPARTFTGWIGLNAVIEGLLSDAERRARESDDVR